MDQRTRFLKFDLANQQAIKTIQEMMVNDDENVRLLVNWLITTDANPYGFLPEQWAGALDYAVGFASLCHYIHHALVDDGDINFIVVNRVLTRNTVIDSTTFSTSLEPRITFVDRGNENGMLSRSELADKKRKQDFLGIHYEIQFLAGVKEFIAAHDQFQITDLKRCFIHDARHDLQDAIDHYQTNPLFQSEWIEEVNGKTKTV